ncbi:hypothetical protein L0337_15660 [candidate division KSB1 bacterium]|nr:hypothetical protein [candidate division KSB1 bacterium]
MSVPLHGKYIYDASGKVVEVILPFYEFMELRRRAGDSLVELSRQTKASIERNEDLSAAEMTKIALHGGAFDWLKDEPDLYSDADGEPV